MVDLSGGASECRCAWLVLADNRELFVTKSGSGYKYLGAKHKKLETLNAIVSLSVAEQLKDCVMLIGDITKQNKMSLF